MKQAKQTLHPRLSIIHTHSQRYFAWKQKARTIQNAAIQLTDSGCHLPLRHILLAFVPWSYFSTAFFFFFPPFFFFLISQTVGLCLKVLNLQEKLQLCGERKKAERCVVRAKWRKKQKQLQCLCPRKGLGHHWSIGHHTVRPRKV